MVAHGAAAGLLFAGAVPVALVTLPSLPCRDSGEYLPEIRFSGAPCWVRMVLPPGTSPMVTLASAPPVFFTVTVCVPVAAQARVLAMLVGVTVIWPAARLKLASVTQFGATLTVFVLDV